MAEALDRFPNSLWAKTAAAMDASPSLVEDISCDVTIVGAGFTGLRAALALAEAGSRVVVIDAGDVGWGASGRTGGQVNPMLPFNGPDQLQKLLGPTYFERLTDVSLNSADELFALIRRYNIDCDARQHGWLRVDHCQKVREVSWRNAQNWNRFGAGMTQVTGPELLRLSGSPAYQSGILAPKGGAVQPMSLVRGLARASLEAGAQIFGRTAALRLEQSGGPWTVHTQGGRIRSEWVILATNGYSDGLLSGLSRTVMPLVSIQIATDPLSEAQIGAILPDGQTISDTRRVIMYARREPGNQMVFGGMGRQLPSGEIIGFDWLVRDATRIFPRLANVQWKYRWGGCIALTEDRLPHLHEPKKGLIAGLGYNGRGVAMSHVMGRVLAERVLGARPESLPFPISSVRRMPFRSVQMMGMGTAVWWMRLQDRLEVSHG
ncbi:MAG: FAD-binding oxidoreductase [Burkholderiaceae bacterium]|nr:MAG: FAD-binding oxidoreductase [Burkholderiaceae bacterium]TAM24653.1 MAG: FAD-binding oxidoreductase [Rhodanobacter sp.]